MSPEEIGITVKELVEKVSTASENVALIDQKLTNLCTLLEKAAGDAGFNRCAVRKEKINRLEKAQTWIISGGIISVAAVIVAELVRFIMAIH